MTQRGALWLPLDVSDLWKIGTAVMIITVCDVAPLNQFKIYLVPNAVRNFNILSLILGQFETTVWSPNPFLQLTQEDFRGTSNV